MIEAFAREAKDARADFSRQNIFLFGAPVPLLREEGLDSCPQEWMSPYARLIKAEIGKPDEEQILFCGLAIGHRDPDASVNAFEGARVPLGGQVRSVGWG